MHGAIISNCHTFVWDVLRTFTQNTQYPLFKAPFSSALLAREIFLHSMVLRSPLSVTGLNLVVHDTSKYILEMKSKI